MTVQVLNDESICLIMIRTAKIVSALLTSGT